jgi:glycine/D-amino acid oxidase-like deaminating enzyme/nitrite reductase/ring-hydroxylating ferredoxin subunit
MKSTVSLWNMAPHPRYPALESDLDVDTVVVGSGITGLTAAVLLAEAGREVIVLEARTLGSGVSSCTTAHLTEAVDARYHHIETAFGAEGARKVAESSRKAIDLIARLVARYDIDCDFARVPGYLYAEHADERGIETIAREYAASTRAGLVVTEVSNVPLPFDERIARSVRYENQACFDAGAYLEGLARAATSEGARIFEHSRVVAVEDGATPIVHLESGLEVRARHVFFATDAAPHRFFLQTKVHPYRSYVLAYETPHERAPGLFWDTYEPYHYLRTADVSGSSYLLVGGADHRTGTESETEKHYDELSKYVFERYGIRGAALRWSSQVYESVDGLPFIGKRPTGKHVYYATGFGGNGLTFGTLAAKITTDAIMEVENPWASLYSASRIKPIVAAPTFVKENLESSIHLIEDWVLGSVEAEAVSAVAPGDGKIVRVGAKRLAVYRDPRGNLHAVSPVCTHLGCHVHFNQAERSWDCACHGSRFDVDGTVLHGPATRDLAPRIIDESPAMQPLRPYAKATPSDVPTT